MTPDCPACAKATTLRPHGPEVGGCRWFSCPECHVPSLIRLSDGFVLRVGKV